mgnify:CR=1 FL=1
MAKKDTDPQNAKEFNTAREIKKATDAQELFNNLAEKAA